MMMMMMMMVMMTMTMTMTMTMNKSRYSSKSTHTRPPPLFSSVECGRHELEPVTRSRTKMFVRSV